VKNLLPLKGTIVKTPQFICGLVVIFSSLVSSVYAEEVRLNWGHYLSNGSFIEVENNFIGAVERRSHQRAKFNTVYSGGLGAGSELLTLTSRGAIDFGAIVPGYYGDRLLYAKTLQIPFLFDSPVEAIQVAEYAYEKIPEFRNELDSLGIIRLFHQPLGAYYLAGPSDDCKKLEGLKGKKVRTFGSDIAQMMAAVGAIPLSIAPGDQYEALERGTLDYAFANLGTIEAYRLYEPGRFICGPILSMAGHMIVVGSDTWQNLANSLQEIIAEEAKVAQREYVEWVKTSEAKAGMRIEASGAIIVSLTAEDLTRWEESTPDLLQLWVEEMKLRKYNSNSLSVAGKLRQLTNKQDAAGAEQLD
jgi:TRAP-type C4-dicarboxylate transport system substrate-binding protein